MKVLNIEIKARCNEPDRIRKILIEDKASFVGTDHQIDTYFNCPNGRLKLRKGNIENSLIFYNRTNQKGPKSSSVSLLKLHPENELREILERAYGIKVEVDKKREIYFIENIKFHIDEVENLGSYVEIEAIDESGNIGERMLNNQCKRYMEKLNILESDLIDVSYSDLLL